MQDTPRPLAPFLDAWDALCQEAGAAKGRRCLRTREALEAGTGERREAVAQSLVALGYPEAMMGGRRMAQALRRLRGLRDARGRYLSMSHAAGGGIWYVVGAQMAERIMGPTEPMALAPGARIVGCLPGCQVVGGVAEHVEGCLPPF